MLGAAVPVIDPLRQPVDLDLFQGPFDLLLTLVLREEVDLFELPVAELVEAALGGEGEVRWDPATTSELVVILAALAEVKARRMLGEPDEDEPDPDAEEARERLASRLVAYEPFRRAARWLAEREPQAAGPRYRSVPLDTPPAPAPRDDPAELGASLERLLAARPEPSLVHMGARRVPLPELIIRLREALARARRVSFDEMAAGRDRLEEGLLLVATLELARRGEVRLSQAEPFGDILIARR